MGVAAGSPTLRMMWTRVPRRRSRSAGASSPLPISPTRIRRAEDPTATFAIYKNGRAEGSIAPRYSRTTVFERRPFVLRTAAGRRRMLRWQVKGLTGVEASLARDHASGTSIISRRAAAGDGSQRSGSHRLKDWGRRPEERLGAFGAGRRRARWSRCPASPNAIRLRQRSPGGVENEISPRHRLARSSPGPRGAVRLAVHRAVPAPPRQPHTRFTARFPARARSRRRVTSRSRTRVSKRRSCD